VAIRVHLSTHEWASAYPGFYFNNLVFGQEAVLRDHIWLSVIGTRCLPAINYLLIFGMIAGGLLLYSAQRRSEYLFLFLANTARAFTLPLFLYRQFHSFPAWWHLLDAAAWAAFFYLIARMYLAFAERRVSWRIQVVFLLTSFVSGTTELLDPLQVTGYAAT